MRLSFKTIGGVSIAALLCIPGLAASTQVNQYPPPPGTLNYIEGHASIGAQPLSTSSVGSTTLQAGQTLSTQNGRAEILLTPGVFLRLDDHSSVVMNSPGLATTELTLQKGRALVEVSQIFKENDILIDEDGVSTKLTKKGLYEFNASTGDIRVFDGRAEVQVNGKKMHVDGGHQLALNTTGKLKVHSFNKKANHDDFYRWASLRSSYLAEANVDQARRYEGGGMGWYGAGWYWDPWFSAYTWIPGDGIFWSPFGYGFYSPYFAYSAPFYGFNYYAPYYRHFGPGYHVPPRVARGFSNGGFHHNGAMRGAGSRQGGFSGSIHSRGGFHGGFGGGRGRR